MIQKLWSRLLCGLLVIFFALSVYAAIRLPLFRMFGLPDGVALFLAAVLLVTAAGYRDSRGLLRRGQEKLLRCLDAPERRTVFWALFMLPLLLKIALIVLLPVQITGDCGIYVSLSRQLAEHGMVTPLPISGMMADEVAYSLSFPHLFWFAVFLLPANLFGGSDCGFALYLALVTCLANVLFYDGLKHLWRSPAQAGMAALLFTWLPSQVFGCLSVTHEIAFQSLLAAVVFFCGRYAVTGRWLYLLPTPIILALMKLVNGMGIVVVIAAVLTILLVCRESWWKRLTAVILLLACLWGVQTAAITVQSRFTAGDETPVTNNVFWTLYLGGNDREGIHGLYNGEDLDTVNHAAAEQHGPDYSLHDWADAAKELAAARWMELLRQPVRCVTHLYYKFLGVWGGTHHTIEVTDWFLNYRWHPLFLALQAVNNMIYLLLLAMTFRKMVRGRGRAEVKPALLFFQTIICGGAALFLVTEIANKYNLSIVPSILAVMGWYLAQQEK